MKASSPSISPPSTPSLSSPPPSLSPLPTTSIWHSPVAYLYGGIAAFLVVIAISLILLFLSFHCPSNEENRDNDEGRNAAGGEAVQQDTIIVVMAGDQNPTFLARHVPSRTQQSNNQGEEAV